MKLKVADLIVEIDILGEHMNQLSETLEQTISELKTANNELRRDIEQKEKNEITQESLAMLHDFLTAREEMKTGQLCLFPFYDFNIICFFNIFIYLFCLIIFHKLPPKHPSFQHI